MEQFKQFILRHFEKILVAVILIAALIGTYAVEEKFIILNFYYLPVLTAGYFLGRRMGVLASVFSILAVLICVLAFPRRFLGDKEIVTGVAQLSSWGGFLILVSFTVGTLYEKNEQRVKELKSAYIGVLEILSKYLESTDRYTKGHSVRVSELATEIAIAMELPRGEVENIRVSGLLHDIGKIEISSEILSKAAELSTEEKELMDLHTVKGAYILTAVGSVLKEVVPIVVAHHKYFTETLENNNGVTPKIPLGARVVAVADAYDAMTTDRPYRKGMPPWEAFQEIVAKTGKQFDPGVVDAFKRVVSEKLERG
ncbi:MAG: HD domain-containing phosphohydrolase [Thermodesulfobacteriota bacterium]|jgi:putative nucleotidyltransferase with HDIG domain